MPPHAAYVFRIPCSEFPGMCGASHPGEALQRTCTNLHSFQLFHDLSNLRRQDFPGLRGKEAQVRSRGLVYLSTLLAS